MRTDNGGEYVGKEFKKICNDLGIIHETTSPHTPEHNGIAERYNRTLQEGALTLQHDADFSNKFWVSAAPTDASAGLSFPRQCNEKANTNPSKEYL